VLVLEADPAGATLAASAGWPAEPGLVSLAAAARRGAEPSLVFEHCQHLPGGAAVLAGPARGDQAKSALVMLALLLGRLSELDADVLVDCGRLEETSPVLGLFERAAQRDRTAQSDWESSAVLVTRGRLCDLQAVASWLEAHPLVALGASDRRLRMAPLVRAARTLAERLAHDGSFVDPVDEDVARTEQPVAGRRIAVGSRVLRTWRAETVPQANGHAAGRAPGEASR
jgi:hypothetical protein